MRDLQIGAEILKEALEREITKEERVERARQQEKAVAAAQVANVSDIPSTLLTWKPLNSTCTTPD